MNYQIGLSILVLAFTACMKVTKKGEAENNKAETQVEQRMPDVKSDQNLDLSDFQVLYSGEKEPNKYSVILKWPEIKNSTVRIFHSGDDQGTEVFENSFVMQNKMGGQSEKIRIEHYDSITEKRKSVVTLEIKPPEDIVFSGQNVLSEDFIKTAERLFILADARIYVQQFNLKIKANKIISEDGALFTNFPSDSSADLEKSGLSGGLIELFSTEAVGRLKIVLNAQNGGRGRLGTPEAKIIDGMILRPDTIVSGSTLLQFCPGNSGGQGGKSGSLVFSVDESRDFILLSDIELSKPGLSGETNFKCFETHIYSEFKKICRPVNLQKCESTFDLYQKSDGPSGQMCIKLDQKENFKCSKK